MRPLACLLIIVLTARLLPAAESELRCGDPKLAQAIDAQLAAKLAENQLTPAGRATDADFIRRVYLDLLGRIPSPAETAAFLEDTNADKRHRLIDSLLVHWEMTWHWASALDHWLNGISDNPGQGHPEFIAYLRSSLAANKPWDRMAAELIRPRHDDPQQQGAAYFLAKRLRLPKEEQVDGMTVAVASVLFGVRLECARCHDHPYVDEWKQDHYYGLASFLSRTQVSGDKGKLLLGERADGQVTFVNVKKETKTARLMYLDSKVIDEPPLSKNDKDNYLTPHGQRDAPATPKFSRRQALIDHALTPNSPYFKRALVNRVWHKLMGRGLVEPVDQIHAANPPSHPQLFALLSEEFAASKFDLRRLLGSILHTEAYARSSQWPATELLPDKSLYAVGVLKPLTPEQLALSFGLATGHADMLRDKISRSNKVDPDQALRAELEKDYKLFQDKFGSENDAFQATTAQALFMTYNDFVQKRLQSAPGNLIDRMAREPEDNAALELAYLAVLSRRPDDAEQASLARFLAARKARAAGCRDIIWALINSAEFRFNH